ncbi:MAG TPA: DUF4864 domain-containing protein [Burkholderiales bacterium]|nr:DUF4864 domain-containing protein [Burkholderiales bacterium]
MRMNLPKWALLLLCALALPVCADDSAPALARLDWDAIREVISRQLDAFRRDDEAEAFSYASPGIRRLFGDARSFMLMVREGYAAVYRPRAVKFLEPAVIDGKPIQAVQVIAPDGRIVVALYSMQRQPDGSWKIDGCQLAPSRSVST